VECNSWPSGLGPRDANGAPERLGLVHGMQGFLTFSSKQAATVRDEYAS